jgi:5-methylcytosine-specific restriction endonuclease McrA
MAKKGDPRLSRKYKEKRLRVLARDGFVCHYCGADAEQVDHIIPISRGGDPVDLDNMVACCKTCNISKGNRSQGVFLARTATPPVFSGSASPTQSKPTQDSPFMTRPNPDSLG